MVPENVELPLLVMVTKAVSGPPPREGWDSNPRGTRAPNGLQDRRLRPLGHPPGRHGTWWWRRHGYRFEKWKARNCSIFVRSATLPARLRGSSRSELRMFVSLVVSFFRSVSVPDHLQDVEDARQAQE